MENANDGMEVIKIGKDVSKETEQLIKDLIKYSKKEYTTYNEMSLFIKEKLDDYLGESWIVIIYDSGKGGFCSNATDDSWISIEYMGYRFSAFRPKRNEQNEQK